MLRTIRLGLLVAVAALAGPGCSDADEAQADANAPEQLLERLRAIDGMRVTALPEGSSFRRWYILELRQPVDHDDPAAGFFEQHMALLHRGVDAPVDLRIAGYERQEPTDAAKDPDDELSRAFGGNVLFVEHRFFGTSKPAGDMPWPKLTARQAAADHHRIVEALKPIYGGPWVSEGASKGAAAALYHHRFYPDDVDAVVAYVATNSMGTEDPRYDAFLDRVGTAECRAKLVAVQRALLSRRAEVLPLLEPTIAKDQLRFTLLGGLDVAYEHAVLDYRFAFWQFATYTDCASLPAADASGEALAGEVDGFLPQVGDAELEGRTPYYYQAATELGSYGGKGGGIDDLLKHADTYRVDYYPPPGVPKVFSPALANDMAAWITTAAKHIVLVNGELDPWSAGAYDPGASTEVKSFIAPGGDHTATLAKLNTGDRDAAYAALGTWLGRTPIVTAESTTVAQPLTSAWQQRRRASGPR